MAAIKKSEARLLVIFGILIFGAITFFVLEVINGRKNDAITLQRSYANKIREYQDLINQKDQWEVKRDFLSRYQPAFRTEEQEAPALESYFRSAAQAEAIEIKTIRPMPPEPLGDSMMAISLEAKVSGPGPDVLRFLIQLQAENRFYAIPSITITADRKDPSLVSADMIFSRWFALDGEMPSFDSPEPQPAEIASSGVAREARPAPVPPGGAEAEGTAAESGEPPVTEEPEPEPEPVGDEGAEEEAEPGDEATADDPEADGNAEPDAESTETAEPETEADLETETESEVETEENER